MATPQAAPSGALGIIEAKDVRVPMRDGVTLSTNVFRPDAPGEFPALLLRTPYGKGAARHERFVRAGYIVATQDSRGRYASEGTYTLFTEEETKDDLDGYDAVEWLAAQPWCDGNVGTFGQSYCGWMQWKLAKMRPPHLRATSAVSIPTSLPEVDFTGSFRPGRRLCWWLTTMAPDVRRREGGPLPHTKQEALEIWQNIDCAKWLHLLPYASLPRELLGGLADWVYEWMKHPWRDPWKFTDAHREIEVPNLDFTGWFDHCWSARHHASMQKVGRTPVAREQQKIVIGPWNHGSLGKRKLGEFDFGPDAELDKEGMMIQWFDHWLKGIDNDIEAWPPVRYYVMGARQWKTCESWPPEGTTQSVLHLRAGGGLTADPPADEPPAEYVYDPRDPVMSLWTPGLVNVPSDRRKLAYRPDILRYETPPLERDVEVVGCPEVVLHAASSARDTDFFARLVDVPPDDGPALDVSVGMVRARYRNGFEPEELLTPGEVVEYRIQLRSTANRFLAGHKIQLELASSDFPNYDRNHNTGRDDLFDPELVPATQTVHHSAHFPSRLILPVAEA